MIQAFFNTDGTSLTAVITVLGSDGAHVDPDSWPITNDPDIVLSSHPSAAKTVTKIDVGVYQVVWTSLSAALTHGQIVYIAVDGAISSTAWTTWQIPIQVLHLPAKPSDVPTAAANATQVRTELATELAVLANKVNVTDNLDGTYDLAFRNAADNATLLTVRYTPATGARVVV